MRSKIFSISLLSSIVIFSSALAEDNKEKTPYYVRLDAGLSSISGSINEENYDNQKLKRAELYGFGIGYIFNKNIRSDLTFTGRSDYQFSYSGYGNDNQHMLANQKFNSSTLMFNTYFVLPINDILSPYLNIGLGISKITSGKYLAIYSMEKKSDYIYRSNSVDSCYNLAWNAGFGNQIKLTNDISIDAFFRYINLGKTRTQTLLVFNEGKIRDQIKVAPFLLQSYEAGISLIYRF